MAKGTKTGGRKAGVPNKATAEIRSLARQHGLGPSPSSLISQKRHKASKPASPPRNALLDRAYGRSKQAN